MIIALESWPLFLSSSCTGVGCFPSATSFLKESFHLEAYEYSVLRTVSPCVLSTYCLQFY
jgi:hypothetical protein